MEEFSMLKEKLKTWWPSNPAIYDIHKTYQENLEEGPFFSEEIPERPGHSANISFLGHTLRSPIGIPAGPLLNSKWISLASRLGFDVLTYKTIRSFQHPAHPLPNIIPLNCKTEQIAPLEKVPDDLNQLNITNSFGNPSQSPKYLLEDINKAKNCLEAGQVLIVSVVGSDVKERSIIEDYAYTAAYAKEAGADIVEANFSCPNVKSKDGSLYQSPEMVYETAKKIKKVLSDTPLIIKLGSIDDPQLLKEVILACSRAGVNAVEGINTLSREIVKESGQPALGPDRIKSGVCGSYIRTKALEFIRSSREIISNEKLDLKLLACGGIVSAEQFNLFLREGADIAMSATAMMWNPLLALEYHYGESENV
jgi:dihydroorotate dehydrogenase (NAD+) catalytic subunit